MGVKVIDNATKVNVGATKLRKGDVVKLKSGGGVTHYGIVTAKGHDYHVTDLTYVLGNRWGDSFLEGTTVAEFNRTHGASIVEVYDPFDVEITINLGGN